MKYLVTGAAGFIGFHVTQRLLAAGHQVVGLDNLNDYYDVNLKTARLDLIKNHPEFTFVKGDLADREGIAELFRDSALPACHSPRRAGGRALFIREPTGLCRRQFNWPSQYSGRVPP